jgi:hypothetical protein
MNINLEELHVNSHTIKRKQTVNYIGLKIDEKLNWTEHVKDVTKKIIKYLGIFNHIKDFLNIKLARQLYFAFVYPHIKYAIETYGCCSQSHMQTLQTIQNKLLKFLLKVPHLTRTDYIHNKMNILKIKDIYNCSIATIVHKCVNNDCPDIFLNYFEYRANTYNTRQRDHLIVNHSKTNLGTTRVKNEGAKIWNQLEHQIKQLNLNRFKREIHNMALSSYTHT